MWDVFPTWMTQRPPSEIRKFLHQVARCGNPRASTIEPFEGMHGDQTDQNAHAPKSRAIHKKG